MSVVVLVAVDWSSSPTEGDLVVELVDSDGAVVSVPGPTGPRELSATLRMSCAHGPDPAGEPTLIPLVVNYPPGLPLAPGRRYQWRVRELTAGATAEQTFYVHRPHGLGAGKVS